MAVMVHSGDNGTTTWSGNPEMDYLDVDGWPADLDFPLREFSTGLQIGLGDFLAMSAQQQAISPENASRLLAVSGISNLLTPQTTEQIHEVNSDNDGSPEARMILAPVLRTRRDFSSGDEVYLQALPAAPWTRHEIFAVDEVEDIKESVVAYANVNDTHPLETSSYDRLVIAMHPKSPRVLPAADYHKIIKPAEGRRTPDTAKYARFAILLSHFDKDIDEATPRAILRRFTLLISGVYPPKHLTT